MFERKSEQMLYEEVEPVSVVFWHKRLLALEYFVPTDVNLVAPSSFKLEDVSDFCVTGCLGL